MGKYPDIFGGVAKVDGRYIDLDLRDEQPDSPEQKSGNAVAGLLSRTDEELDARGTVTADDAKQALSNSTPEMRPLLEADAEDQSRV